LRYSTWPWYPGSGSLKVIGIDTDGSTTYDFLLTFHSNHEPISYIFGDKRRFQSKIAKFSTPRVYFAPPLKGFPLELGTGAGVQKARMVGLYRVEKEVWGYLSPSGYSTPTWQTDRRIDRRTDTGRQQRPRLRIASRGKNDKVNYRRQISASKFGCCFLHGVRVCRRSRKFLDTLGPHPLKMGGGGVADPKKRAPPHVLYTRFGRSGSNHLGIWRLPKFGDAGPRPFRIAVVDHRAKFGHSTSSPTRVIMKIRQKIRPFASRLSRSLKVIGTDTDRSATSDFLLIIRGNHGHTSHPFRAKRQFRAKVTKFSHHRVFNAVAEGISLGIL